MAREISLASFVLVHEDHQPIQYGRGFRFDIALVEVEEDIVQDDRSLNLRRRRRWRWWRRRWRWWRRWWRRCRSEGAHCGGCCRPALLHRLKQPHLMGDS